MAVKMRENYLAKPDAVAPSSPDIFRLPFTNVGKNRTSMFSGWNHLPVSPDLRLGHPIPLPVGELQMPPFKVVVSRHDGMCCGVPASTCRGNNWKLNVNDKSLTILVILSSGIRAKDAVYFLADDSAWRVHGSTMFIFPGNTLPHGLWAPEHDCKGWASMSFVIEG